MKTVTYYSIVTLAFLIEIFMSWDNIILLRVLLVIWFLFFILVSKIAKDFKDSNDALVSGDEQ